MVGTVLSTHIRHLTYTIWPPQSNIITRKGPIVLSYIETLPPQPRHKPLRPVIGTEFVVLGAILHLVSFSHSGTLSRPYAASWRGEVVGYPLRTSGLWYYPHLPFIAFTY